MNPGLDQLLVEHPLVLNANRTQFTVSREHQCLGWSGTQVSLVNLCRQLHQVDVDRTLGSIVGVIHTDVLLYRLTMAGPKWLQFPARRFNRTS